MQTYASVCWQRRRPDQKNSVADGGSSLVGLSIGYDWHYLGENHNPKRLSATYPLHTCATERSCCRYDPHSSLVVRQDAEVWRFAIVGWSGRSLGSAKSHYYRIGFLSLS